MIYPRGVWYARAMAVACEPIHESPVTSKRRGMIRRTLSIHLASPCCRLHKVNYCHSPSPVRQEPNEEKLQERGLPEDNLEVGAVDSGRSTDAGHVPGANGCACGFSAVIRRRTRDGQFHGNWGGRHRTAHHVSTFRDRAVVCGGADEHHLPGT